MNKSSNSLSWLASAVAMAGIALTTPNALASDLCAAEVRIQGLNYILNVLPLELAPTDCNRMVFASVPIDVLIAEINEDRRDKNLPPVEVAGTYSTDGDLSPYGKNDFPRMLVELQASDVVSFKVWIAKDFDGPVDSELILMLRSNNIVALHHFDGSDAGLVDVRSKPGLIEARGYVKGVSSKDYEDLIALFALR